MLIHYAAMNLECIFTVICNLVTRASSLDEELEMAKLISAKVAQQPNDRPALRLKILFNLYNLLENPYSRFFVYTKALDLATIGKVIENIIPSFKKIDSLLQEWNIGKVDQRDLFLTISNILKDNKSMAKDSFNFLNKYLATFSSEDEDSYATNETKEEAVRAIIEFVKSPDLFQDCFISSTVNSSPCHVYSTYFGTKPPSLDIVRIFNFSNEVYRRILQAPFSVLSLSQNKVAISFEKDQNVQSFELHYNACNASLLPCSSNGVDDTHQRTSSLVQKPIPAGRQASSEDIKSWKEKGFTSLIVAAPEMDVGSIIEDLLPLLSYYAPFAIYHQYLKDIEAFGAG
ncbi:uncharacterized protein LOC109842566 [Asparagus officinalis]|uniref:uncharacterized protein LOC109842566 n=1 Tax=Asparagus officinalis TaxID=4686 RepID=UPI00098E4CA2|nr:uncharacterized protein LOC109842566 [Asparagus officinalis]